MLHVAGDHSHTSYFRFFTSCRLTKHAQKQGLALSLTCVLDLLTSLFNSIVAYSTRLCMLNSCGFLKALYILTIRPYPPRFSNCKEAHTAIGIHPLLNLRKIIASFVQLTHHSHHVKKDKRSLNLTFLFMISTPFPLRMPLLYVQFSEFSIYFMKFFTFINKLGIFDTLCKKATLPF